MFVRQKAVTAADNAYSRPVTYREEVDPYYDPFDFDIDDDPYPVWRRLREEAPLYYNEKYNFYALSTLRGRRAGAAELADLPLRSGHHDGHHHQRYRGAAR